MWALSRRSGLFVVSYAPLAAMFVALKWPAGWSTDHLVPLAVWLAGVAGVLVLPLAAAFLPGGWPKRLLVAASLAAAALMALGVYLAWYEPMSLRPSGHRTSAAAPGVAFGFCIAALEIVVIILLNARRVSALHWRVTDARDQGGAVAGYLATYLLPLLNPDAHGWRVAAAYGIYLFTIYVVFVRSDKLVLVNPTLYLCRYRIFDVLLNPPDGISRRRVLLISRQAITRPACVDVVPLGDDCYLTNNVEISWAGATST